ncbi:MAG: alpha-glucosidase [Clostridia bacterium]|nr:alpha-glucosidase [Clostridia bacterium]
MKTEDLIFYQIYPKSFCDSNGDGVGDLRGILSKIDYIKNLGVNAVWLTPCFKTPNVDNGYDISDYRAIEESVGTLDDLDELIEKLHENGIAIILDLVANHTSTEHKWFKESRKSKDNPYRDYYIWRETPPNDWQSSFGGSAWELDGATGEYYLHSFAIEQADLNWDNPKVREEMKAVVDFWLARGVDGFRCDVLDLISKDWKKNENGSGPRLHEYIRELFDGYTDRIFTVGECWSANAKNAKLFCGKDRKELTTVFAFKHLCVEKGRFHVEKPALDEVVRRVSDWQLALQEANIPATVFFENHDQPRSVSRIGDDEKYRYESATLLGGVVLLHRGVPFLMQGQEIGMTNSRHNDIGKFNDVESMNFYRANVGKIPEAELIEKINFGGRDNPRCMMPWTEKTLENGWLAPYTRQSEINVESDLRAERSVYGFYRELIELRKNEPCLTRGEYIRKELTPSYYIFERAYEGEKITVVCNFRTETPFAGVEGRVLLNNYPEVGETLKPYQLIVYKN